MRQGFLVAGCRRQFTRLHILQVQMLESGSCLRLGEQEMSVWNDDMNDASCLRAMSIAG